MKKEYKELVIRLGIETLDWLEDIMKQKLNGRKNKNERKRNPKKKR